MTHKNYKQNETDHSNFEDIPTNLQFNKAEPSWPATYDVDMIVGLSLRHSVAATQHVYDYE